MMDVSGAVRAATTGRWRLSRMKIMAKLLRLGFQLELCGVMEHDEKLTASR